MPVSAPGWRTVRAQLSGGVDPPRLPAIRIALPWTRWSRQCGLALRWRGRARRIGATEQPLKAIVGWKSNVVACGPGC
jgi:hypothetical protein